jgi:hypothetical protein
MAEPGLVEFQKWLKNTVKAGREELKLSPKEVCWALSWILQCELLKSVSGIRSKS